MKAAVATCDPTVRTVFVHDKPRTECTCAVATSQAPKTAITVIAAEQPPSADWQSQPEASAAALEDWFWSSCSEKIDWLTSEPTDAWDPSSLVERALKAKIATEWAQVDPAAARVYRFGPLGEPANLSIGIPRPR